MPTKAKKQRQKNIKKFKEQLEQAQIKYLEELYNATYQEITNQIPVLTGTLLINTVLIIDGEPEPVFILLPESNHPNIPQQPKAKLKKVKAAKIISKAPYAVQAERQHLFIHKTLQKEQIINKKVAQKLKKSPNIK